MATCKECIHFDVCEPFANPDKPQSEDNGCYGFKSKDEFVQVVRCKDCKHYHKDTGWCDEHSHFVNLDGEACHPWESAEWKMFDEDDFCSNGERRATNEAD